MATDEILAHRADVALNDKYFFGNLQKKVLRLASVPKNGLASRELRIPVGMAIDKGQPVFLAWLQAVAADIRPEIKAEMAKTVQTDIQAGCPVRELDSALLLVRDRH
ncbi:hypothetical protein PQR68_07755 [Paraburkholderia agricolaris]|uniref:hypothetical protein n=1 Tax=Paraburkholderia agricolaris TaxID=2152888 RepID=UPI0038B7F288